MKRDLLILICAFIVVGCAAPPTEAGITAMPATETRVATSTATDHPTETVIAPTLGATVVPSATVRAQELLSEEGPWHVYDEDDEIYATNADGSGYFEISFAEDYYHREISVSTQYDLVSILSGTWRNENLYIYELPSGHLVREIDLYICPSDIPDCEFNERGIAGFLTWSPNGRYLAFAAARGGTDTDLYVYDAENDEIIQLTNGDNNVGDFFWSPDSQWIVNEAIDSFDIYAEAIWAAKVDGSVVTWLARSSEETGGDSQLLGWVNNEQFIVWRRSHGGGSQLRLIDVQAGFINYLFEGYFMHSQSLIAFNPGDGVIAIHPYDEGNINIYPVILVSLNQTTPYNTDVYGIDGVFWDPISGDFIALGFECTTADGNPGDAYAFNIDGKMECVVAPEEPVEERLDYIVVGGGE